MIEFAVSSTCRWPQKLTPAFFEEAAACGFTSVEIVIGRGHFRGTTEETRKVLKTASAYGLKIVSAHCDMQILDPPDLDYFRTAQKVILGNLDLTSALGGKYLIVHSYIFADPDNIIVDKDGGLHPGLSVFKGVETPGSGMLERVQDGMAFYTEEAARRGVCIALETDTRDNEYLLPFIEKADTEHCGICFDSGHAQIQRDAAEFARLLAPRVVCTHLHDNDGVKDLHMAPFKGVIDWNRLIGEFIRAGYSGDFTFECRGDIRDVAESRERIRRMLNGKNPGKV